MLCPPGGLDGHDACLILVSEVLSDNLCGGHSVSGSIFRSSWRSTTSLISLLERARVGNGWARRLKFGQKRPRRPMSRGEAQAFGRPADERETKLSIEFPDQTKINFCRLGRLKARPEQSPPHCYRDAHRPRWRYSTTRAPEGSTRATAWPAAQRSWSKRATARMPLSATQHASAHPFSSTSS